MSVSDIWRRDTVRIVYISDICRRHTIRMVYISDICRKDIVRTVYISDICRRNTVRTRTVYIHSLFFKRTNNIKLRLFIFTGFC